MLRLSTKSRYALRAMLELALREGTGPVQLREVAKAQHISAKYLEQTLAIPLNHAGLVRTERGPSGGYRLAKPAGAITALDIVEAVEGPLQNPRVSRPDVRCERSSACAARERGERWRPRWAAYWAARRC